MGPAPDLPQLQETEDKGDILNEEETLGQEEIALKERMPPSLSPVQRESSSETEQEQHQQVRERRAQSLHI